MGYVKKTTYEEIELLREEGWNCREQERTIFWKNEKHVIITGGGHEPTSYNVILSNSK